MGESLGESTLKSQDGLKLCVNPIPKDSMGGNSTTFLRVELIYHSECPLPAQLGAHPLSVAGILLSLGAEPKPGVQAGL